MNIIDCHFSEFIEKRNEIEMSIDQMKYELSKFGQNILLYGAGSSGIAFLYDLKKIGVNPLFFVDSDKRKVGSLCEGIRVISPDCIIDEVYGPFLVIVCINTDGKRYCKSFDEALRVGGHHGVYDLLHKAGCENVIDYTYFRHCFEIFKDEKYNAPSCSDVNLMVSNREVISDIYDILDDDISRRTYERIIKFRLLDDSLDVPTNPQDLQYFETDLYHPRNDAVFVDAGAYNGISMTAFLKVQGGIFEKYYGFEPDSDNYLKLCNYIEGMDFSEKNKSYISDCALWDKTGEIGFYSLNGPGSFVSEDIGSKIVKTTTIDNVLDGEKATFIKMNIEGSEKQALDGAKNTIRDYKPELAVAGYHRTDDLWKIPKQIISFRSDYRVNLRSYMNHISFVYYAY